MRPTTWPARRSEETGIGRVHYKVLKNLFGSEGTWKSIEHEKTVGIVSRDERAGVVEIATPAGVVAGIVPTTNPTSTALNKAIISVKGRNAIVISPHPRARRCIGETVEVLRHAIERAGGPPDLVASLSNPTIESTAALMSHRDVALILATGGSGLVEAAYSSGKPAYGVGPGNVPVYVDRSADVAQAARWIVSSQSFDNATLCCSEQGLVLDRPIADRMLAEMQRRGAHLCSPEEVDKLAARCNVRGHMCPDVVGKDPHVVAGKSGFSVPRETSVLLAPQGGVGRDWPLSIEILCPLLSVHVVDGWEEGCDVSLQTLRYGGLGHTIGLWARDETVLDAWFLEKPGQPDRGQRTDLRGSGRLQHQPAGRLQPRLRSPGREHHLGQHHRASPDQHQARRLHERGLGGALHRGPRAGRPPQRRAGAARIGFAGRPEPASGRRARPRVRRRPPRRDPQRPFRWATPVRAATGAATRRSRAAPPRPRPRARARAVRPRASRVLGLRRTGQGPTGAGRLPAPHDRRARATADAGRRTDARSFDPGALGRTLRRHVADPGEIEGILAHAGHGCPLGPCKGCAHHDVTTGACTA